ncbi:conserved hypothetical protein [Treponema pallidum subsp. pallidum str. Chicago]|nr:conserved hypothetical protein [Treponema pallidum subsp. pallidum str. Chicago]
MQEEVSERTCLVSDPSLSSVAGAGSGVVQAYVARQLARQVHACVDCGMRGIRRAVRRFAADVIAREAPELTAAKREALLDAWVPSPSSEHVAVGSQPAQACGGAPLPADVQYSMVLHFVWYGLGVLSEQERVQLEQAVPHWPQVYWSCFSPQLKRLIKACLTGLLDVEAFCAAVRTLLGIAGMDTAADASIHPHEK